jgi:hypothetical protein
MFVDITKPLMESRSDEFIIVIKDFINKNLDYLPLLKRYTNPDQTMESYVMVFSCDADAVLFRLAVEMDGWSKD